jgi:hypothetical protein
VVDDRSTDGGEAVLRAAQAVGSSRSRVIRREGVDLLTAKGRR